MRAFVPTCIALAMALSAVSTAPAQVPSDPDFFQASFRQANAPTPADPAAPSTLDKVLAEPAPESCEPCWGEELDRDCFTPCCWTFAADGLVLFRSAPSHLSLARTAALQAGSEAFNAHDLEFDAAGGWRISAIRQGTSGDLELTYFQADGFQATGAVAGAPYLVSDAAGGHLQMTAPWMEYRSRLYSGELNLRRPRNEWLTLLAGLRYVELDEHFKTAGLDAVTVEPDQISARTANHLLGFQLGADGLLYQNGRWTLQGITKAGVYLNHAKQAGYQLSTALPTLYTGEDDRDVAAFLGEIGLVGTCQVTEHMSLRLGYQCLWLDGVATATDQMAVNSLGVSSAASSSVETGNTVFYHGAVAGAEFRW